MEKSCTVVICQGTILWYQGYGDIKLDHWIAVIKLVRSLERGNGQDEKKVSFCEISHTML